MPVGNVARSLWVVSPGKKKEPCGWLRLPEGGKLREFRGSERSSDKKKAPVIERGLWGLSNRQLINADARQDYYRSCILGHPDRVCQPCLFHLASLYADTLPPSLPFCQ